MAALHKKLFSQRNFHNTPLITQKDFVEQQDQTEYKRTQTLRKLKALNDDESRPCLECTDIDRLFIVYLYIIIIGFI